MVELDVVDVAVVGERVVVVVVTDVVVEALSGADSGDGSSLQAAASTSTASTAGIHRADIGVRYPRLAFQVS